ncbi:MAG: MFS transporter, partial [Pseudomonadota bacterium]
SEMISSGISPVTRKLVLALLLLGTTLGLAGTDLVLPAVPGLPDVLDGDAVLAQLVLAAFVAGAGLGLLLFGWLGAVADQRLLLTVSLFAYAAVSALATMVPSLAALVAVRFVQGLAGAAAAVFAPGMIRSLYDAHGAVRALGVMGSIESLVPALAPLAGVGLLHAFGWQGSFWTIAVLSVAAAVAAVVLGRRIPAVTAKRHSGSYAQLLLKPVYLRYALSHACTLGALLVFVFGAPAVIVGPLGGSLTDFIVLQVAGIAFFIVGANTASRLVARFGAERVIAGGSLLSAFGAVAIFVYALVGGRQTLVITALFVPMNMGLGFRGPPGFYQAVVASDGDDARGSALVLLAVLTVAALGTAAVAPFITVGLAPLASAAAAISVLALVLLSGLPKPVSSG